MGNIALSIDDELLLAGRKFAHKRNTSLNAMIRKLLAEEVKKKSRA